MLIMSWLSCVFQVQLSLWVYPVAKVYDLNSRELICLLCRNDCVSRYDLPEYTSILTDSILLAADFIEKQQET